jgi:hypothetical protein
MPLLLPPLLLPKPLLPPLPPLLPPLLVGQAPKLLQVPSSPASESSSPWDKGLPLDEPQLAHQTTATSVAISPAPAAEPFFLPWKNRILQYLKGGMSARRRAGRSRLFAIDPSNSRSRAVHAATFRRHALEARAGCFLRKVTAIACAHLYAS